MLTPEMTNYLNKGILVAAEVPSSIPSTRCFVRIRAIDKPGVPREEYRYLNSRYSMWEYWNYEFRRMVLRSGWEENEWDYDCYLAQDERILTRTEAEFFAVLARWISEPDRQRVYRESECPE
jgi:hypothetical protein